MSTSKSVSTLDWRRAVREGLCTAEEADLYRSCVERDADNVWFIDQAGLSDRQVDKLVSIVYWATCTGPVQ